MVRSVVLKILRKLDKWERKVVGLNICSRGTVSESHTIKKLGKKSCKTYELDMRDASGSSADSSNASSEMASVKGCLSKSHSK